MDAVIALIKQAHAGDKDAREKLISDNLGLVWSIVRRFEHRGHEREELFQIGCIGLMKAIDKFETAYEVKFSTYAVPMIMGEIKRFLRDGSMMKVSRTLKENGWKVKKASDRLSQEYGRDATLQEISKEIGLSVEDIVEAIEANEKSLRFISRSISLTTVNFIWWIRFPEAERQRRKSLSTICFWNSFWESWMKRKKS